jgi:two-component system, OmpR family, sensor kinase
MNVWEACLKGMRGRLLVWYLGILALLLTGLCIFQTVVLTHYFRSANLAASGHSSAAEYSLLLQARVTLIVGALAVFAVTAIIALPVINRALSPLLRVTQAAEAIAQGDLTQRANLPASVDEVGRLGHAFDIMVDRLQGAMATTSASEERMRRFLADASHELRTPLTVLRGTSQVLLQRKDLEPEELDDALSGIHEESIRLARLVDDLLTLSRLDSGQALDPHPVPVRPFLEEFVRRYASAWPARRIEVETIALDGIQAAVDPEALRRILTNLVDNAARYSAIGSPIVVTGETASNGVSIAVRDEGPGLAPEDAKRVFERFYRVNKSRSRGSHPIHLGGGSGLGLSIVQALVQQSKGEIRIDTGPQQGTTVAVTLPGLKGASLVGVR